MAAANRTFKSQHPDINLPKDVSLWSWLLDSPQSCADTERGSNSSRGFTDTSTGYHLNYSHLKGLTTHLSTALRQKHGLQVGDVVVINSRNSIWYPVVTLAAVRIGAIACGLSPDYTVDELAFCLTTSKSKVIFTTEKQLEVTIAAARKAEVDPKNVILLDGSEQRRHSIQGLINEALSLGDQSQVSAFQIPKKGTNHDVCAFLCFSSGTTGLPKAVMISHGNIIAQCLQIQQITPANHDKILAALPFHHITGIVHQLHLPILLNANVYVIPNYTLDELLRIVEKYQVEELLIVPPILIRMVKEPATVSKYNLSHVRRFSSGAAPLSKEILTLLERQFPRTGFKQGYGMTESCSAITSHPPSKYSYKYADKVGTIVSSTEVRIVDLETGEDCPVGKAGEIWVRGPQVAMGYLNNPKSTAETFDAEGFLHTGDIGLFDAEGLLSITDRMKEMIKVKGIGVAPAELENLLLGHITVHDCAVCGIPDERAGEKPKAFVVLKPQYSDRIEDTARDLIRYVRREKARHKWISEIEIVSRIPKNAAGKILRKKLRGSSTVLGRVVRDEPIRPKL